MAVSRRDEKGERRSKARSRGRRPEIRLFKQGTILRMWCVRALQRHYSQTRHLCDCVLFPAKGPEPPGTGQTNRLIWAGSVVISHDIFNPSGPIQVKAVLETHYFKFYMQGTLRYRSLCRNLNVFFKLSQSWEISSQMSSLWKLAANNGITRYTQLFSFVYEWTLPVLRACAFFRLSLDLLVPYRVLNYPWGDIMLPETYFSVFQSPPFVVASEGNSSNSNYPSLQEFSWRKTSQSHSAA